ncbi:MAG: peptidase [Thalassolituus sp. CG17_big_fil_post_rev_8_21_14_2_50_53_8]|nr:MAG: peptidase [Thalassolituus sp. CG17_big_fil_post_rev_8_21_14_2_50_53_8]
MATDSSPIAGTFQLAGRAEAHPAIARINDNGSVQIIAANDQRPLHYSNAQDMQYGDIIPGLPAELIFADGARFIPTDAAYRWPGLSGAKRLPAWLETHWVAVLAAVILVPGFIWLMVHKVIPSAASASVQYLPEFVATELGEQTLDLLDRFYMEPTQVSNEQQEKITADWHAILQRLELPEDKFRLYFRASNIGANAFALPDGSVILTDGIVELMQDHPEQLNAVLLHEIGHVEHKHSLKTLAQATATTMMFAMMFGDIDGAGEMIIGAGTSLLQSAFSRDMEREADAYAYTQLHKIGHSPMDFANAMRALMKSHGASDEQLQGNGNGEDNGKELLEYLSSHPDTLERIKAAEEWQPETK